MSNLLCARLNNGMLMPAVALGTWQLENNETTTEVCLEALKMGYHAIDTADVYGNQEAIGRAIAKFKREMNENSRQVDTTNIVSFEAVNSNKFYESFTHPIKLPDERAVFVTGKFFPKHYTKEGLEKMMQNYLDQVGRSADLILMHWPANMTMWSTEEQMTSADNFCTRLMVWHQMEEYVAQGKIRAIGVSNFMAKHLEPLIQNVLDRRAKGDTKALLPVVNQIELSPLCRASKDLVDLCEKHKVFLTSYSTMGSTKINIRDREDLKTIAKEVGKTPSQILLRWALQKGYLILPRTSKPEHARENLECQYFSLSSEQMAKIDGLHSGKNERGCPDPHLAS